MPRKNVPVEVAEVLDLNQTFEAMKAAGGCDVGCRLYVLSDIAKLATVVRHIAPGASQPDDKEIEWSAETQSGYQVQQEIVTWLWELHGVPDDAEPPADTVVVAPEEPTARAPMPLPIAGESSEAAPEAAPAEDEGAEGPH